MSTPSRIEVSVVRISDTEWRVSDPRHHEDDGFVRLTGDVYETTEIGFPFVRRYFATLDAALDQLRAAHPLS